MLLIFISSFRDAEARDDSDIILPCRRPLNTRNGSYTIWGNNMLVEYKCDTGLFALGRTFGSCNPITRRWSIKPIKCVAPGCEIPGDPPHGRFYFEHNNSVSLFVCDEGFRQTGARARYCDGYKWHGIPPKCKDKYPSREIRQQQELNFTTTTLSPEEVADKQLLQDILDADNTCFTSYKPPPELSNATKRIQYKYNSVRRQWIMIANYSCNEGFKLKNIFASYLYCKSYNWTTSIQPECVPEIPEKNPCESPNKGGCEQLCEYHGGTSYSCLCKEGFARKDNYFGCVDIDECRLGNGGCQQTCNNLPGSYFCSCRQGYITSGSRCIGKHY